MWTIFIALLMIWAKTAKTFLHEKPQIYCKNETEGCQSKIDLFVNRLTSLESAITYDYSAFGFCQPQHGVSENLGQVLFGDRIYLSGYEMTFMKEEICKTLCSVRLEKSDKRFDMLKYGMLWDYNHQWFVDNTPVSWYFELANNEKIYSGGFPIGCYVDETGIRNPGCLMGEWLQTPNTFFLYNHIDITVHYRPSEHKDQGSIARVTAVPRSYQPHCGSRALTISGNSSDNETYLEYTYSVYFEESTEMDGASRCGYLIKNNKNLNVQWFSVFNSFVISFVFFLVLVFVLVRNFQKYKALSRTEDEKNDTKDDEEENSEPMNKNETDHAANPIGWRSLHADVFRPPRYPMLFAALNGVGSQILLLVIIFSIILNASDISCPSYRGTLGLVFLSIFVGLGLVSGYTSGRLYKTFGGENWKMNAFITAIIIPGPAFLMFLIMNFIHWRAGSAAAIPITALLELLAIWLGVLSPITFIGAFAASRRKVIQNPTKTSETPRPIPPQPMFTRPIISILIGGILPFGCIFIQCYFFLQTIWFGALYISPEYLIFSLACLFFVSCEVTVLLCFLHLAAQDHRWWWRSFLTSGCPALYFFLYATHFYLEKLLLKGAASAVLYFGYTLILTFALFLFCGYIGSSISYSFVRFLYSTVVVKKGTVEMKAVKEKNIVSSNL